MIKSFYISSLFVFFSFWGWSGGVDSLKAVYPNQSEAEKALTLCELCYQLSFIDSREAIHYGRLGP